MWRKFVSAIVLATLAFAQSQPEFEAASVKPGKPGDRMDYGVRGSRLWGRNMSALGWIQIAFGVRAYQVIGPAWIAEDKFDIEAKIGPPYSQSKQMLQNLLADRFKLKVTRTTRDLPVYDLVIAKGGLKMRPSKDKSLWGGDYPNGAPDGQSVTWGNPKKWARAASSATPFP